MSVGIAELSISAGDIRWTVLSPAEHRIEAKVGAHLLAVHKHSAVLTSLFQAQTDGEELRSGLLNVSAGLVSHGTGRTWVGAGACVITIGSGAVGLTRARRYGLSLVPAGMRRVDYGKSTGLLGWVLVDDGAQVKVDLPTIDAVNIPFYGIVMTTPPVL